MGISGILTRHRRLLQVAGLVVLAALGLGAFMSFGPPGLYAKSGTPEFCARCHVMETEYEDWFHTAGHRRVKCIECHLPSDSFPRHIMWKGIEGMWDSYVFYSGRVPERISLSAHGAAILNENCRRCHSETVANIKEDRNCWQCHRRLSHRTSGSL